MESLVRHLSVAKAARLAGVARSEIQARMQNGELDTFDGSVRVEDLLRVYPDIQLDDDSEYERVSKIKANAFGRRVLSRVLPAAPVLAHQINLLGTELGETKTLLAHYRQLLADMDQQLKRTATLPEGTEVRERLGELQRWLDERLSEEVRAEKKFAILSAAKIYRAASAHVLVEPANQEFLLDGQESILQAGLRAGLGLDYGCANGSCGRCRARLKSGSLRQIQSSDFHFADSERNQGWFLMCTHTAVTDLVIDAGLAGGPVDIPAQTIITHVSRVEEAAENVRIVRLRAGRGERLRFLPGQSARLTLTDGGSAVYPVASCPCDGSQLEFHVARGDDPLARKAFAKLAVREAVRIDGPIGDFTLHEATGRPIIGVAVGTGFAALRSIIEHAHSRELEAPIHLYWICDPQTTHYAESLLRAWADTADNFRYELLTDDRGDVGRLSQLVKDHPNLDDHDLYVAADATTLPKVRQSLLGFGALPDQTHATETPG